MRGITTRNFRILCDFMDIREFMVEIYEKDWRNGVPAPFWEYALSSRWMDTTFTHRCRIWEKGGRIVAFVYEKLKNNKLIKRVLQKRAVSVRILKYRHSLCHAKMK